MKFEITDPMRNHVCNIVNPVKFKALRDICILIRFKPIIVNYNQLLNTRTTYIWMILLLKAFKLNIRSGVKLKYKIAIYRGLMSVHSLKLYII